MGFEQKRNLIIRKIHLGSSSANELVGERNCSCFYPRADPLQDDGTLVPPGGSEPQLQKQFPESPEARFAHQKVTKQLFSAARK